MKSYAFLFLVLIFLSVEQSFASSWLISPAGKLTSEDKATLKTLQKYQEPLNQKSGIKTPTTTIPTTTNNQVLAKQLDAIFSALQKKISGGTTQYQNAVYKTLISRIKNIQAKNTNLSEKNRFILDYLLQKSNNAIQTVKNPTGTGSTSTGTTTTLSDEKTIGGLTLTPMIFSSEEDTEVALGKFTLTQDITLNDLTLTIKSDDAIDFSKNLNNIELQKSSGITIGSPRSYEIIDANTIKVFFDSAYFLRTSTYVLVGNFENNDNSYYYTYVDYINTSKGSVTYSTESYLLSKTTITK